ncbi:hypothetical protein PHSC3_000995 [Chlamydiales bacterium STE3]|nr:hypothetical protein PHSC3_000995 [Chlamydiales bacterium STE3]
MNVMSPSSLEDLLRIQNSLLSRLDNPPSFSVKEFIEDVDTVINKLWNMRNTLQDNPEALLKMYKITKKIFTQRELGKSVWEKISLENKTFLRIFQPLLASPEVPATSIDAVTLRRNSTYKLTFPDKRTFHLFFIQAVGDIAIFILLDEKNPELSVETKTVFTYYPSFINERCPRDLRASIGVSGIKSLAVSGKGGWAMEEGGEHIGKPLPEWLKFNLDQQSQTEVASQIAAILFKEKEFGIQLFLHSKNAFSIKGKTVFPTLLPEIPYQFIKEYEDRHLTFLEKINCENHEFTAKVKLEYEKLKIGPNEHIFNILKEAYAREFITIENLKKTDSIAYQIAYALQASQKKSESLITIPWGMIGDAKDLFFYLNFILRADTSYTDLFNHLYTKAKDLIRNIPKKGSWLKQKLFDKPSNLTEEIELQLSATLLNTNDPLSISEFTYKLLGKTKKSLQMNDEESTHFLYSLIAKESKKQNNPAGELLQQIRNELTLHMLKKYHESFFSQDSAIRNDLTAILYSILSKHYLNKNASLNDFLDDLLEKIKKQLNEDESLKLVERQINEEGEVKDSFYDPVLTPGDYFITLFWQDFHDQLRMLPEFRYTPDPLADLACLRVLHAVAPRERQFISRQLEKVLKDNYKKMSRQKLEKELKSRFEEFKFNP